MKHPLKVFGLLLLLTSVVGISLGCAGKSFAPESLNGANGGPEDNKMQMPSEKIDYYQNRYPLDDTQKKLVDNRGNGFESLYGTRNVRAVLSGVVYRGGANNLYNKHGKRSNMNPLPDAGLKNLCREGFSNAVYLYPNNFASAARETSCTTLDGRTSTLAYSHYTPFSDAQVTAVFEKVQSALTSPSSGPIYLHCWNGWHASGLISAYILRQFCGMSADAAVKYWDVNTDGNDAEKQYGNIRQRIRDFKPKAGFGISAELKSRVCPN